MNQNYPENILSKLREYYGLEDDDTHMDQELQELSPSEAFEKVMDFEGIIGYSGLVLRWIEDIYKVRLDYSVYRQSKQDFVQGLGNIFNAQDMDDVVAMRMDEDEVVTVFFSGGGTHAANVLMDSKRATISDILKQAF